VKNRDIEIYVGYCNHTWETQFVSIPSSTPEDKIKETAINTAMNLFHNNPNTSDEVAFVGIYNVPEMEESP